MGNRSFTTEELRRYYEKLGMEFEVLDDWGVAKAAAITATGDADSLYAPKKGSKVRKAKKGAK